MHAQTAVQTWRCQTLGQRSAFVHHAAVVRQWRPDMHSADGRSTVPGLSANQTGLEVPVRRQSSAAGCRSVPNDGLRGKLRDTGIHHHRIIPTWSTLGENCNSHTA